MPTGKKWKIASPINHKKLYKPAKNWEVSTKVFVPSSTNLISPITDLKPKIRPPQISADAASKKLLGDMPSKLNYISAGISGVNISAKFAINFCTNV